MLFIDQLSVCHGANKLLDNVTFEVGNKEKVGIVGASGSGKTVLAHALLGFIPQGFEQQGGIICNEDIALIPQSAACLNPTARVSRQLKGLAHSEAQYHKTIKHCQLDISLLNKYPGELSGGMAKRVLIALGLVQGKSLLVADEPTSGLDHDRAVQLLALLTTSQGDRQSMVVISHDIVALTRHVDRLLVFHQGKLVDDVTIQAGWYNHCDPYTQALWQAAPEHWYLENGGHYAKSA
ncbi:ATP-binding cassette domain-containing protein [Photobacterium sp. DA100]|uniref:ATP-binding cassette domain-containing protein n=1 Tax=Photobacterium sp. DA100 TaxID=3027472 RepID=UPI00247AD054|nr:ATP-binding cassette domain-containing protein [Photobacterium sp. DA100]WEM41188.1 ATP-binding cassette domain-containing protein [Photobacterium sp. DA100]